MAAASDAVINADPRLRIDLVSGRTAFKTRLLKMPTRREIDFSDTLLRILHITQFSDLLAAKRTSSSSKDKSISQVSNAVVALRNNANLRIAFLCPVSLTTHVKNCRWPSQGKECSFNAKYHGGSPQSSQDTSGPSVVPLRRPHRPCLNPRFPQPHFPRIRLKRDSHRLHRLHCP
ncbi:hypothetical protein PHISCL_03626 [Aspergillus sclerotialis]|uniref:Uncharacterized protein n=1 Tax=Aspergillus sclerotialis TaxID=2070753 RepID=A0A3A2ZLL0_9EURO|nr:hypothetical protein PHISCL_03626 [Aspergillus sclerotialis]